MLGPVDDGELEQDRESLHKELLDAGFRSPEIGKAFGGALVMDDTVVVTSATGMIKVQNATTPPKAESSAATSPRNRFTPANFGSWEERPSEPR